MLRINQNFVILSYYIMQACEKQEVPRNVAGKDKKSVMENQKLEDVLNLSLQATQEERAKSLQLEVGFLEDEDRWELIVKHNGSLNGLNSSLIMVEELIAGYAIVTLPESLIEPFTQLPEVEYVEKPKRLYFTSLAGNNASCIPEVTRREPYLTGEGVLVAILDSGIDYQSPEFRIEDGRTRIRYLWDQTLTPARVDERYAESVDDIDPRWIKSGPPEGFSQGVVFSSARIDAALKSRNPQDVIPSFDTSGHGTAVATIAAGNGNYMGGQYQGVATGAELLIVKLGNPSPNSFPKTTELMRGLTFAVKTALELSMPLAVNLSFGNTYGSHDGTSLLERFIDNITEIGRTVVCVGSGNEGAAGGHASGSFRDYEGRFFPIELNVGQYQPSFSVQLWKAYTDTFRIRLRSPGEQEILLNVGRVGVTRYRLEDTQLLIYQGAPSPYSVRQEIYVDFIPVGSYVNNGSWEFLLEPGRIVEGDFDFYLPSSTALSSDTRFFSPTPDKTLTIPSTSAKVITVGAYDVYTDAYADFSGRGVEGQNGKPDVTAPGVGIATLGPDGVPIVVSGTSFATPFVTGTAALLMEWGIVRGADPFLYGEKIKAYLRRGAQKIRGETVYPNNRTGWGALCAASSIPGES